MRTPIESYVVRIYRCGGGAKRLVVGVVQVPRLAAMQSFTNVDQLWEILSGARVVQRIKHRDEPEIPDEQLDRPMGS